MKPIACILFSLAAVALTGCSTTAKKAPEKELTLEQAIQQDISLYMQTYSQSKEAKPCVFSEKTVADLYKSIPEFSQQTTLEALEYQLKSKDEKTLIHCAFARNGNAKITFEDLKKGTKTGLLLHEGKAYSFQGNAYMLISDRNAANMVQLLYDLNMDFNAVVRNVKADMFDSFKFDLDARTKIPVREPVESVVDDVRCYKLTMLLEKDAYAAEMIVYVDSEGRRIVRSELKPMCGLASKEISILKFSNHVTTQSGFKYAGSETQLPAGKPEVPFVKSKLVLNKKYQKKDFQPVLPLVVPPKPAPAPAKKAAPAPAKKAAPAPAKKAAPAKK